MPLLGFLFWECYLQLPGGMGFPMFPRNSSPLIRAETTARWMDCTSTWAARELDFVAMNHDGIRCRSALWSGCWKGGVA